MNTELLEEIGLTKSEIKVYLAMLELGSSSTGKIVEKSKASSSKIYEILDKLIDKGLASFVVKSGVKYFEAAPPARLQDYMKEKEKRIIEQTKELDKIIPQLKLKQQLAKEKSETLVFKGMKGAETAFQDILNTLNKGDELLVIGFSDVHEQFQNFLVKFHKKRANLKIKLRGVFGEKLSGMVDKINKFPYSKVKYLKQENPIAILIYKNKTLFSLATDHIWIQIENKNLADSFRVYFEQLWTQETSVTKGFDALKDALDNMLDELGPDGSYTAIGATLGTKQHRKEYIDFFKRYHKKRISKNIRARLLFEQDTEKIMKRLDIFKDADIKFLPYKSESPVEYFVYNEKIIAMIPQKEPTMITINNKEVANSFKSNFEQLWNQETKVLKGLDAVQRLFEEMLEAGHCDFLGARGYFIDEKPKFIDEWEKKAKEKGFTMRNIVDPETKGHRITQFSFAETKYTIPKEFTQLSVFWIYGNKVAISNWMEKEPMVIMIENKNLYNMYKQQFETLWNKGSELFKELG